MNLWVNRRYFFRDGWRALLVVGVCLLVSALFLLGVVQPDDSRQAFALWGGVMTTPIIAWGILRHLIRPQVYVSQDNLRWRSWGWQRKGQASHSAISGLSIVVRDDIPILQLNVTEPPLYLEFPIQGEASKLEAELRVLTGVFEAAEPGENTWRNGPW